MLGNRITLSDTFDHRVFSLRRIISTTFCCARRFLLTDSVRVDVHGDVLWRAHEGLHRLYVFIVFCKQCRKRVTKYVPGDRFVICARCAAGRM